MFAPMRAGNEAGTTNWEEPSSYAPGRYRAHPTGVRSPPLGVVLQPADPAAQARYVRRALRVPRPPDAAADDLHGPRAQHRSWTMRLLRPSKDEVDRIVDSWWKRWSVLLVMPCALVWIWCAMPFPVSDPNEPWIPFPDIPQPFPPSHSHFSSALPSPTSALSTSLLPNPSSSLSSLAASSFLLSTRSLNMPPLAQIPLRWLSNAAAAVVSEAGNGTLPGDGDGEPVMLPVDANFYFFLFFFYGAYLAVALLFITKCFDLYRLNWWPSRLGGLPSYTFFWSLSLFVGWVLYKTRLLPNRSGIPGNELDWERKSVWVGLAFFTMALPAAVCWSALRRDKRMTYRHSMTETQKTFLERHLPQRMPRSYVRFLWFISSLSIALICLLAGQGYASVYLGTLPHSSIDGAVYVWTWVATVNLMMIVSCWILESKVRSRALLFVFKFYFMLVYFCFYRNLFARLRSPDQYGLLQLLSSLWVVVYYPLSMTRSCHRLLGWLGLVTKDYDEWVDDAAISFWIRNLAQNVTMVAFLGWLTLLHFGPNSEVYPYFRFDTPGDPYTYKLTIIASSIIWASELLSSLVARLICDKAFGIDVTNLGLDELREFPELLPALVSTTLHVLMDMLLFLIKLNFR